MVFLGSGVGGLAGSGVGRSSVHPFLMPAIKKLTVFLKYCGEKVRHKE